MAAKHVPGRGLQFGPAGSQVAARVLFPLDRLEQRLEVALAEAERPVPFDQLEEDRGTVTQWPGEDLQQVAVLVPVDQDPALLKLLDGSTHVADPLPQLGVLVVGVRRAEELHAIGAQGVDRGKDVVGRNGEVLGPGAAVEVEVLVDLRTLLGDGRLVERELHPVVPACDDLAHQRRVVGRDVVADELRHVREAHDLVVELHPLVHVAELDIADDVVQRLEQSLGLAVALDPGRRLRDVAGEVGAVVLRPVDQGVPGLAVRRDGCDPDGAVLVGEVLGLAHDGCAGLDGLGDAPVDVGDLERDVHDTVTVTAVVIGQRAVGVHRAVDHELDRAGAEDEGLVVAVAVLRTRVGDELHPPRGLVVVRGLGGVADDEDDRVPAGHGEHVALGVVLHEADQLLELVHGQVGADLVRGQGGHWPRIAVDDKVRNTGR